MVTFCLQGSKVNINSIDAAKAGVILASTVQPVVLNSLVGESSSSSLLSNSSSSSKGRIAGGWGKNPLEAEVKRDIMRRIEALWESRSTFEPHSEYVDSMKDADDARLIVQGIDPAAAEAARNGERFVVRREIPIERRHWVASMRGVMSTRHGCAFVHSDGSVTMLSKDSETQCKCGAIHTSI